MKKSLVICLCCILAQPPAAYAYGTYGEDNPFVEAMLRMMEIFGLINRDRLPLGVPYLPDYGQQFAPGLGGLGGFGGLGGLGSIPGMSPMYGLGGVPGMSPMYGLGGVPGMSPVPGMGGFPGAGGVPGGNWGNLNHYPQAPLNRPPTYLDGIWELDKGGFVIIKGNIARLYVSQEQYQDFAIHYDRQRLWWRPKEGGKTAQYTYRAREGRMILRDGEGSLLLMRRRR